jgi:hypothetical protein
VFEFLSPLTLLLVVNSFLTIGFILNQNESTKDSLSRQSASSLTNPLEIFTWGSVFFQFFLFLVKLKMNEFS